MRAKGWLAASLLRNLNLHSPMKRIANRGFTLIEMLTVMLIIAILAALILGVHGYVSSKSSRARAEGEIQAITAACESYKAENGSYPRLVKGAGSSFDGGNAGTEGAVSGSAGSLTQATPPISPINDGDPTNAKYQLASRYLYGQLSGDVNYDGIHQTTEATAYLTFRPDQLGKPVGTTSSSTDHTVAYLQDPYGNSYGYSTAGATDEESFQQNLAVKPAAKRPTPATGFNSTFDLWSTGGRVNQTIPKGASDGSANDPNTVWARWIKNW
jgi:prepilin-type N-terminal cleavage/methylation domain-containing protein